MLETSVAVYERNGDPPTEMNKLSELTKKYDLAVKDLVACSNAYESRPPFIIELAKQRTGKELVAKAIHENSDRSEAPFVAVNCGAIPDTLIESECFGYKKGAFTGAEGDKKGFLAMADGGTLFLDEIRR